MEISFSNWMTCLKPSIYWNIVSKWVFQVWFYVGSVFQIYNTICYKEDKNRKCKVTRRLWNLSKGIAISISVFGGFS